MMLFLCLKTVKVGFGKSTEYSKGLNYKEEARIQDTMQTKFSLPILVSGDQVWRSEWRESMWNISTNL